jgi:hypothetical protein
MPLFRQLVPMEAMICWPLPLRQRPAWDGRTAVYFKILLAGFRRPENRGQPTTIFPPFAMMTINYANGLPVEWVDLRYSRPWPSSPPVGPVGEHPHPAVADLTVGEYGAQRDRLFALYDELAEALLAGEPFARQDEFGVVFGTLAEPGLMPYYRAVAPRFVERFLGPGPAAGSDG